MATPDPRVQFLRVIENAAFHDDRHVADIAVCDYITHARAPNKIASTTSQVFKGFISPSPPVRDQGNSYSGVRYSIIVASKRKPYD